MLSQKMVQYFNTFFILGIVSAQVISLSPEMSYQYETDGEQYSTKNLQMQDYELTITGKYRYKKLKILTRMGYHLIDGMDQPPSDFTRKQGLHEFYHVPGLRKNTSDCMSVCKCVWCQRPHISIIWRFKFNLFY